MAGSGFGLEEVIVAAFLLGFVVGVDEIRPHVSGTAGLCLYFLLGREHSSGLAAAKLLLRMAIRPNSLYRQCLECLLAAGCRMFDVIVIVNDVFFGVLRYDLNELLLGGYLRPRGFFDDPAADVEG